MKQESAPRFRLSLLASAILTATLAGCAVHPKPFTVEDRKEQARVDGGRLARHQQPITAPLTLADAVARALKYNMEHRQKRMMAALAADQADLAKYDLLPQLTAKAGYSERDSYPASSSMDISNGTQSLVPSTSQEKTRKTADLNLTWNILDFGVSYWKARQQADRAYIAEQHRRKAAQVLVQNVEQAYWLAAGAQQLGNRVDNLLGRIRVTLNETRQARQERLKPSMEVLNYQKTLLELVRQLEPIRNELIQAKPRLAALMNLMPGNDFSLAIPQRLDMPVFRETPMQLQEQALLHRPELIEADYQERIDLAETKKAILRLLPGIEFSAGEHWDENRFLVDNRWSDGGVSLAWNLLGLLSAGDVKETAERQVEVTRTQRLALSMAVLSQVEIAYRDFQGKKREFGMAGELERVDRDILRVSRETAASGAESRLLLIRAEASALISELRRWQSYSNLSLAWAQLKTSVGVDVMPAHVPSHELEELAQAFSTQYQVPISQPSQPQPKVPQPEQVAVAQLEPKPTEKAEEKGPANDKPQSKPTESAQPAGDTLPQPERASSGEGKPVAASQSELPAWL